MQEFVSQDAGIRLGRCRQLPWNMQAFPLADLGALSLKLYEFFLCVLCVLCGECGDDVFGRRAETEP